MVNVGVSMIPAASCSSPASGLPRTRRSWPWRLRTGCPTSSHPLLSTLEATGACWAGGSCFQTNYTTAPHNPKRPGAGRGYSFGFACPSARYNPNDEYYYAFGGGTDIQLSRDGYQPVQRLRPSVHPEPWEQHDTPGPWSLYRTLGKQHGPKGAAVLGQPHKMGLRCFGRRLLRPRWQEPDAIHPRAEHARIGAQRVRRQRRHDQPGFHL